MAISFIRKITHKAVINIVKRCISNNLTSRFACCKKYPLFFEKLFKYIRNNERSGFDESNSDILIK